MASSVQAGVSAYTLILVESPQWRSLVYLDWCDVRQAAAADERRGSILLIHPTRISHLSAQTLQITTCWFTFTVQQLRLAESRYCGVIRNRGVEHKVWQPRRRGKSRPVWHLDSGIAHHHPLHLRRVNLRRR